LNLAVGDVSQSLTVSGEAPVLRAAESRRGTLRSNARCAAIPP
jgi:hypothetical protein